MYVKFLRLWVNISRYTQYSHEFYLYYKHLIRCKYKRYRYNIFKKLKKILQKRYFNGCDSKLPLFASTQHLKRLGHSSIDLRIMVRGISLTVFTIAAFWCLLVQALSSKLTTVYSPTDWGLSRRRAGYPLQWNLEHILATIFVFFFHFMSECRILLKTPLIFVCEYSFFQR